MRYEKKTTLIAGTSRQVWNTNRIVIYGAKGNSGGIVIKFQNRENPQPRYMTKKKGDDIYDCIRFNDYRKHIFTRNCEREEASRVGEIRNGWLFIFGNRI